ncbi:cation:proton antiporter subunit C [Candidatus Tisiphia endosymbiont of Myopa tessellatipennis]|uniref:cation:proton antiporter subunit C n=1 Tax=Candidatus Tisiphia endosymbiont of Myopa tessellatipennis TaxID=3066257 RepID=UPI00313BCE8E
MFLETIYISKILYFLTLLVLVSGLFIMLTSDNYVRKIIGLSVMQSSVLIFYLMLGKVSGGIVPIERTIDFSHNSTSAGNLCVDPVLESSRTFEYAPVLRSVSPTNSSAEANYARSLILHSYSSPLPQVLMLTAIVVGFATLSLGLSLIYRISKQFNTISEGEINFSETTNDRSE